MTEKISVIIPLYNKGSEIERTLNSVIQQTFQNFEIIIVDDHSDDEGLAIVKNFSDPRITIIEQEHRGVSFTRNHGVNLATSDFIAFLDADDEWMPKHLETIFRLIKKYPHAGMYTTAYKIQTPDGKTRWANYKCIPNPPWEGLIPDYFKPISLGDHIINSSQVVIPKKIFYDVGGFPEGYWYGEDIDLFGKIALKYPIAFSWELGGIYHEDALIRARHKNLPLDYQEPFISTARIALMNGEVPQELTESLIEYIWRMESQRAIYNLRVGNSSVALNIFKQCDTKWHHNERLIWLLLARLPPPLYLFIRDVRQNVKKIVRKNKSPDN